MKNKTVIKASAGTGKTYSLSLEYIYYLLKGVEYNDILVMTFTNKATFEIQERILEFLNAIITNKDNKEELIKNIELNFGYIISKEDILRLKEIYKSMLINRKNIRIDTIDGFTRKVFDECIAEPILDLYNYNILSEDSEEEKEFYDELILELINNKDFKISFEKNNIEDIKNKLMPYRNSKYKILGYNGKLECKFSKKNIVDKIKNLLEKYEDDDLFSKIKTLKHTLEENIGQESEIIYKKIRGLIKEISSANKIIKKKIFKNLSEDEINDIHFKIAEIFIMIYEVETYELTNEYINNANVYYDLEFNIKKRRKVLEFNDITYYTLKYIYDNKLNLVKDNKITPAFIDLMGGNFEVIMVDEFQDTSIDQFKFIKLLIDNAKYATCVGDEKQSIYEWRGGYKRLFEILETLIGDDVEMKTLQRCYRSEKKVVEFVNETFESLANYNYESVDDNKKESKGYVQVIKTDKKNAFEDIVLKIKENKDYGNSAILLRGNNDLEIISQLLDKESIPYSLNSKSSLLELDIVKKAHCLVQYLVTKNELKKIEFLRLKPSDFSITELQNYLKNKIKEKEYLEFFIKEYNKHNNFNSSNFDFAKEYIKYFGYGYTNNEILNLNEYFKIMKSYPSLYEFYDHISKNKKEKQSIIEENSVILQTIHASKGLEYDNVYIFEDIKNSKDTKAKEYCEYDEKNNFEIIKFKYANINILQHFFEGLEQLESEIAKQHILDEMGKISDFKTVYDAIEKSNKDAHINAYYVGFTRAKKNLYIYSSDGKNSVVTQDKSYGEKLNVEEITEEKEVKMNFDIPRYFNLTNYETINFEKYDIKRVENQKKGSALHYFLEIYDGDFDLAKKVFLKKFGNLFSNIELKDIIKLSEININKYKHLFNSKNRRYSEFKIYDKDDKLNIIDLLIIDDENKKIYIFDYKSGNNLEDNEKYKEQLQRYENLLSEMFKDYEIFTELLKIER